jgi:large subunit ribosomal protein L10
MPSTRKEREETVNTLTRELEGVQGLVVAAYAGVKTPELNELRDKLRPFNSRCSIVKNTLAKIVLKTKGIDGRFSNFFEGPSALIIQKGDPLPSLKVIVGFAKAHGNYKIRAGYMDGKVMNPAEIIAMAALPPKKQLLAQLAAGFQGPLYKFQSALSAHLRTLSGVLDQVAKKKERS